MYRTRPRKLYRWRPWLITDEGDEVYVPNKWDFPFCMFFTNQAGTVILSFVGFTLMLVTLLVNWFAPNNVSTSTKIVQHFLLHVYLVIMLVGFILAFVSAYHEISKVAVASAFIVGAGTILFILYFIMSCLTESMAMLYVCPEMRCADHHWLQDAYWRGYMVYSENIQRYRESERAISKILSGGRRPYRSLDSVLKGNMLHIHYKGDANQQIRTYFKKQRQYSSFFFDRNGTEETSKEDLVGPSDEEQDKGTGEQDTGTGEQGVPLDKTAEDYYIHLLSKRDEGSVLLIILTALFTMWLLGFFIYSIITFYAYGVQLSLELVAV